MTAFRFLTAVRWCVLKVRKPKRLCFPVFTITGGFVDESMYEKGAAGIEGSGCFATIRNNLVTENHGRGILMSTGQGGVFYNGGDGGLRACRGLIENNIITKNTTLGSGGGLNQCNGTIQNNEITSNSAFTLGGLGGGIFSCNGSILNNKIQYNYASSAGGGGSRRNGEYNR